MSKELIEIISPLSRGQKYLLCFVSWVIVAFGQPAWSTVLAAVAAIVGHALFWRVLIDFPNKGARFWYGTIWFTCVQLVQLSWAISHPYLYIYPIYLLVSFLFGLQYGVLALLFNPFKINRISRFLLIASAWTLLEWSRLFILSGLTWNPIGLSLTGNIYTLQWASLWGVYGLSFWVILVNLFALKIWIDKWKPKPIILWTIGAILPYIFGVAHIEYHQKNMAKNVEDPLRVLLVQTAFPVEESMEFSNQQEYIAFVLDEWDHILQIVKKQNHEDVDLIALPEFVVPFGTYTFLYPYSVVKESFKQAFGEENLSKLPPLELPLAHFYQVNNEKIPFVNNAFLAQALANVFDSELVVGLEDVEEIEGGERKYYSSAIYFQPIHETHISTDYVVERYDKRVLVPMGEYIPFSFLQKLAESYGVAGSFTCGTCAKVWDGSKVPFGVSICYEETFGNLMRENKLNGAKALLNLTSDVWYPNSRLPKQHFDHARLRTVENGIPLIRACNTGITGACDSLGRIITTLGEDDNFEWLSDSIKIEVPTYSYRTLYERVGDGFIIGISLLFFLFLFRVK